MKMETMIILECINKVLKDDTISKWIEKREKSSKVRFHKMYGVIVKRKKEHNKISLLVRVGLDFEQKEGFNSLKEDILANITYSKILPSGSESFKIGKHIQTPEIDI